MLTGCLLHFKHTDHLTPQVHILAFNLITWASSVDQLDQLSLRWICWQPQQDSHLHDCSVNSDEGHVIWLKASKWTSREELSLMLTDGGTKPFRLPFTVTLCSPVLGWVKISTWMDTSPTASSTPEPDRTDRERGARSCFRIWKHGLLSQTKHWHRPLCPLFQILLLILKGYRPIPFQFYKVDIEMDLALTLWTS